jgi:hypothetical protein
MSVSTTKEPTKPTEPTETTETTETAAAAAAAAAATTITSLNSNEGKAESKALESNQEAFHIKTFMDYLPIIVIVLIIFISMVSSDLLKNNWHTFATLVIAFVLVSFIHYFTPTKFFDLEKSSTPPTFLPKLENIIDFSNINKWYYVIGAAVFGLGIALGFSSINVSGQSSSYDPSVGLITVGSLLLFGGFLYFLLVAFKYIPKLKDLSMIQNFTPSNIPLFILMIVIGIPLIVRGNEMKTNIDTSLKADKIASDEYKKTIANNSADIMLGIGLFFQIAVFIAIGYCLWSFTSGSSKLNMRIVIGICAAIIAVLFMPGGLFLSKSLGGPGFEKNENKGETYEDKTFMVHGIVYIIVGIVMCLILFGQMEKLNVFKGILILLPIVFFSFVIISWVFVDQEANKTVDVNEIKKDKDSVYYNQLRTEAIKEIQKKSPNGFANESEFNDSVDKAVEERLQKLGDQTKSPVKAVVGISSIISIIIIFCFGAFYHYRKKLMDSTHIKDDEIKNKVKEDKMLSTDWDKILNDIDNNVNKESKNTVRFAKWFSYIPFLSVILLVMWVSVLFTNVTTSPKTSDWIASKFTGDMFPRVKELIDTFFIVIIVGLLLCGILLFPMVKELNVGGLDSMLKFAESVQVWQFNKNDTNPIKGGWTGVFVFVAIFVIGLSWWWDYLARIKPQEESKTGTTLPVVPENWGWAIAFVVMLAICTIPSGFHIWGGIHADFENENSIKKIVRSIITTVYLVPLLIIVLFRIGIYSVGSLTGIPEFINKRNDEFQKLKFWEWNAGDIDLRMFPTDRNPPTPASVTSDIANAAPIAAAAAPIAGAAAPIAAAAGISETKVSAIGKLIKVLILTISFVILILTVVYYVYKIDAELVNKGGDDNVVASGGIMTNLNSPTAHTIYVIIAIVAVAGIVAYIREKFKTANNNKTPENYLFDDMKTEDEKKPLRQLAFGATHIVYIILMVIVWIYDRDKDDKERMSVTGMTILGLAILFFHYGLEFIDTMNPSTMPAGEENKPSITDLFRNVRFIINTVFFIVLCTLAYYKQHSVMVVLILFMFIFHLTKSYIGLKIMKLIWLGIIFIPCLLLDMIQSSQSAVGDTTRTIWIILVIEILLIAILYGGPYLLNYIGASASQIVAAPVSLEKKYDTQLNTQSPQIFIYHNTGIDRSPEDKAANCPVEEKKRYNYSISGWVFINNSVVNSNKDLEIFNFGDVPKLTYNKSTTELKLWCNTLDISSSSASKQTLIYNSKINYNTILAGKSKNTQDQIRMLVDNENELDVSFPLQKWNYFVVNYNGKTMDLFMNNRLLARSEFIMPDIVMKPITVGDGDTSNKGLNGTICNLAFHKFPLTKEQIRWTYTMLKSQNPPMIGMKTIEDEVTEAGTTTIYSK